MTKISRWLTVLAGAPLRSALPVAMSSSGHMASAATYSGH